MNSDDFHHEAFSPASALMEWALVDSHLSPMVNSDFTFWRHLDIPETSAATKACWESILWDVLWSLISNAKEWRVSRNMVAFPLMCILSINKEVAISGTLRTLIRGMCFRSNIIWSTREMVGQVLKLTLIPRKVIVDISNWLWTGPDLDFIVKRATSPDDFPTPQAFCNGFADQVGLLDDGGGSVALSIMAAVTNKVMEQTPNFLQPRDLVVPRPVITTWMADPKTYVSYHL